MSVRLLQSSQTRKRDSTAKDFVDDVRKRIQHPPRKESQGGRSLDRSAASVAMEVLRNEVTKPKPPKR